MKKKTKRKIQKYCTLCGTQSCNPFNKEDRKHCPYFNPKIREQTERLKEIIDNLKKF